MFELLMVDVAACVRTFLGKALPAISDDWWKYYVFDQLTFRQQNEVEVKKITSLTGLDLAALLRIFDRSWYELSFHQKLDRETRDWLKKVQTARNNWAHFDLDSLSNEDVLRDLNAIEHLLSAIGGANDVLEKIQDYKVQIIDKGGAMVGHKKIIPYAPQDKGLFEIGELVELISDPDVRGAIIGILQGQPEYRYKVFCNNKTENFYARQLRRVEEQAGAREIMLLDAFHANLSALQLQHPSTENLYSLHAARINYTPYQFRPVLKFIRADRPRLLIADEVGVGKTIEAGLILRELQARGGVESVLVLCPKPLVTERKWFNEMKRFDENFMHLDSRAMRYCIDETDLEGEWPASYSKCIVPFSLASERLLYGSSNKSTKCLADLDPAPKFDLVIVDEAHHIRNASTYTHQMVRYFCDNAEAVVFLSATPIQLGSQDLFTLLNLLRPDLVIDENSFSYMSQPNPHINRAVEIARQADENWQQEAKEELRRAADTGWGRSILSQEPDFQNAFDKLGHDELSHEERVHFIRNTEQLYTFSNIINRTRRRDIGQFTVRGPETISIDFTPQQQALYDEILEFQKNILSQMHGDRNLEFMVTTLKRQLSSCVFGLVPLLDDMLTRKIDDVQIDEIDNSHGEVTLDASSFASEAERIRDVAENLDKSDPKLDGLLKVVRDKQNQNNNKILLFSGFRHTLSYLQKHLEHEDVRVGLVHGDTPDEERRTLRRRFSLPKENEDAIDLLLSSEVGCEGLDYQFCDTLVNFDIPWNPMRIEQRIGRIDRYGQKSEKVLIYNFITPGTIDATIYARCLWRIGVFHQAIGGSEEILGVITKEINDVATSLELTEDDREEKLQQLADNAIRHLQEQNKLEEEQSEFFGLNVPGKNIDEEVEAANSFWLSPQSLGNLVNRYLNFRCGAEQEYVLGDKERKTLRVKREGRDLLLEDFQKLKKSQSPLHREWRTWLKGNSAHLSITFSSDYANQDRDTVLITPVHPLAVQAAMACGEKTPVHTCVRVVDESTRPGSYPFAIYMWQQVGARENVVFQPVVSDESVETKFFKLLENAGADSITSDDLPAQSVFDALDSRHHQHWLKARGEHRENTTRLVECRRESLKTSHKARMTILAEQLGQTNNEKIQKMRKAQIDNANAEYARKMQELEDSLQKADVLAQPIAYGVLEVLRGA